MPASQRSIRWYLNDACRLVARSPGAAFRFPLAIVGVHHRGNEVDTAARRLHATHRHRHRVAQPNGLAGALADQRGTLLVEVPPLAAQRARRQEALEALVAEAHERAAADEPNHLPVEGGVD